MTKVKTFFLTFLRSVIPNSPYYSKIIKTKFSHSVRYFLGLILILNTLFVISLAVKYNPKKISALLTSFASSLQKYPDDLVISVTKGRLTTNYLRPYLFWLENNKNKQLVLVIDEFAGPQKIQAYKSMFLLTPNEIVFRNERNKKTSIIPLTYLEDRKISKQSVNKITDTVQNARSFLPVLSLAILFIMAIFVPLSSLLIMLLYLLLSCLTVFIVYKFFAKKHFRLKKILQISLHASSLPLLVDYILIIFRPAIKINNTVLSFFPSIPFPVIFFFLLAMFIAVGVYEAHYETNRHHLTHKG